VNLKDLIPKLKAAIIEKRWFDVARLAADAIRSGADLGELLFGGTTTAIMAAAPEVSDSDLADLEACVEAAKAEPVKMAAGTAAGIDPATVLTLVTLALELIKRWRQKK
jgi:hypothetical protein